MLILDYLAPKSCAFCVTALVQDERSICGGCRDDLPWNEPQVSPAPEPFDSIIAPLRYDFPIDAAVKALKFNRKLFYLSAFSEILSTVIRRLPDSVDSVLPVPLHWRRKATRGFNQAVELARPVARQLNVPLLHGVYRQRATPYQSGLHAAERLKNLRHAFATRGAVSARHALIVDDVMTTGTTVHQLRKLLQANGVEKVSVLVLARAVSRHSS